MKKAFGSLAVFCLGVGSLVMLAGCEAQKCDVETSSGTQEGVCLKSLTRFQGSNPIVKQAQWTPGSPITIESRNGDIDVVRGTSDVVVATFRPVVYLAHDSSDERVNGEFAKLNADATGDMSGAVLVKTSRMDGAASTLGADIRVELPPTFDGALAVQQDNGSTDIDFAGSATSVKLNSDNGGCNVTSSAAATAVDLLCDNGDLSANISGAPPGAGTRSIRTDLGDIGLSFVGVPSSQPFNVQAFAAGTNSVVTTVNEAGAGCTVQVAGPNSKTISCHGATTDNPTYVVRAEKLSDITLTF